MADRPILFSGPMIRALIDGRKTQTRRVVPGGYHGPEWFCDPDGDGWVFVPAAGKPRIAARVPFAAGDRLWVRETWSHTGDGVFEIRQARIAPTGRVIYAATPAPDAPHAKFWPSIHMPREFSRLTLIVTDVRVERLRDISDSDAIAEGVEMESADPPFYYVPGIYPHSRTAVGIEEPGGRHAARSYAKLWNELNAARGFGWDANPFVIAITFSVHNRNINETRSEAA